MKKTVLTVENAKKSGRVIRTIYDDLNSELGAETKEELDQVSNETLGLIEVFRDAIIALMSLKEDIVIDVPDEKLN